MPPKILAKNDRAGGVLPVNAAARTAPAKAPAVRLKLEVRRLPPGLTLTEFEEILGDEWKLGNGKVDWREYRQGKIKSPGKIPEQSRCYIHLKNEPQVKEFEAQFLSVVFHDKAGTHKLAELKHLLPSLGFAPNQRTPLQAKHRADNRQGTIDQDAEFIAFLEAETQPIVKPTAVETVGVEKEKPEPIKSTPLIDDLREKKANKAKAAATKAEKDKEKKMTHVRGASKDVAAEKEFKAQSTKVEHAAKEAAKVLTKQAAGKQQKTAQAQSQAQAQAQAQKSDAAPASPARPKKLAQPSRQQNAAPAQPAAAGRVSAAPQRGPPQRQRGNAEGIKKMLQKDLGIKPKTAPTAPAASNKASQPAVAASNPQSEPAAKPPTAPAAQSSKQTPAAKAVLTASPSSTSAMKAYLKHANPSQGMTEVLIMKALGEYGELTNVTIDPRKGTAIAVFKDNAGLKKAMEAKRVTVANGAVEIVEFKERQGGGGGGGGANSGSGGGRGGLRGGRGGGRAGRGGGGHGGNGNGGNSGSTSASASASPAPAPATVAAPSAPK